jgi:hypothetical protein
LEILIMRFSTGFVGAALVAGVLGAVPAFAGTPASISGSATLATPAGFVSTVSGESVLPSGYAFESVAAVLTPAPAPVLPGADPNATLSDAAVIVVPSYSLAGGGTFVTNSLSVGSSAAATVSTAPTSFSATAAQVLVGTTTAAAGDSILANTEFINAIIKSGAGVNGLD